MSRLLTLSRCHLYWFQMLLSLQYLIFFLFTGYLSSPFNPVTFSCDFFQYCHCDVILSLLTSPVYPSIFYTSYVSCISPLLSFRFSNLHCFKPIAAVSDLVSNEHLFLQNITTFLFVILPIFDVISLH